MFGFYHSSWCFFFFFLCLRCQIGFWGGLGGALAAAFLSLYSCLQGGKEEQISFKTYISSWYEMSKKAVKLVKIPWLTSNWHTETLHIIELVVDVSLRWLQTLKRWHLSFFLLSLWFSKPLSATYHFRPIKRTVLKSNQYARRAATKKPKFITKPAKNA